MGLKIRTGSLEQLKQINDKIMKNVGLLNQHPKFALKKLQRRVRIKINKAQNEVEEL